MGRVSSPRRVMCRGPGVPRAPSGAFPPGARPCGRSPPCAVTCRRSCSHVFHAARCADSRRAAPINRAGRRACDQVVLGTVNQPGELTPSPRAGSDQAQVDQAPTGQVSVPSAFVLTREIREVASAWPSCSLSPSWVLTTTGSLAGGESDASVAACSPGTGALRHQRDRTAKQRTQHTRPTG